MARGAARVNMFRRQKTGSVLCPSCGQLVGVNDDECLNCGRKRPGMWGLTGPLRGLARGEAFVPFVMWACAAVYLASLAADPSGIRFDGLGILSPSPASMFRFGAAGYLPVFLLDRWWTPLSAGWLHAGLIHIGFNLLAVRNLGPLVSHLYGASRTILIYVISSACGFVASSIAQFVFLGRPWPLGGAGTTLGASAAVFGLIGAALHYGRRGGSSLIRDQAVQWIVSGLVFGFLVKGIDNWAHLGGLAGGYLVSIWLDPMKPERGDHAAMAVIALVLSLGSVLVSLLVPLPAGFLEFLHQLS
ncbi:MAG TPA: rhomboid family intramembrane serine protease [Vicinamibacteria bacterium]|nr:rhomboid family intramembrane serine protease [Vicinamibacteria bacterium]